MNSVKEKVILRYLKEDLDATRKVGRFYLDTSFNPNLHTCEVATIEADNKFLNEKYDLYKGDRVLVQYLIMLDEVDKGGIQRKNNYFMEQSGEDELRWCHYTQIYGKQTKDGFVPLKGWVFCEPIKKIEEREQNGIILLENVVDSENKGYQTKIVYIHPFDEEEYGLRKGDCIMADRNTDASKKVFNENLLRVPATHILAILNRKAS